MIRVRVLDGWLFPEHGDHAWSAHPEQLDSAVPCLVVTGDLDAACDALSEPSAAEIQQAARAMYRWFYPDACSPADDAIAMFSQAYRAACAAAKGVSVGVDEEHRWTADDARRLRRLVAGEETTDA